MLEGLAAVRKRPGMYIGGTGQEGAEHCVFEVVDNAVDEALDGHCSEVRVTRHSDGSWSVKDDGRGIPPEREKGTGIPGMILVMTRLHAGSKFGGKSNSISGGLHGVGVSAVNAVSKRLDLKVLRGGRMHSVSFRKGEPGSFDTTGPDAKFTMSSRIRSSKAKTADLHNSGTTVRFWFDEEIFQDGAEPRWDAVVKRCKTISHLTGVQFALSDEVGETEETVTGEAGLSGLVEAGLGGPWRGFFEDSYSVGSQVLQDDGSLEHETLERTASAEVALGWNHGSEYCGEGYVNAIHTPNGGTHLAGAERSLVRMVSAAYDGTRILGQKDPVPSREDILEGLSMHVSIRMQEPEFLGQTKNSLTSKSARPIAHGAVEDAVGKVFKPGSLGAEARAILKHIAIAAKKKAEIREFREIAAKKKATQAYMPVKLKDCRNHGAGSELFIVEGDSAAGSVSSARDSEFQAFLPIRGKILNAMKATPKQMLDNSECYDLVSVLGGGAGDTFDLDKVRYDRIFILVDADVDGSHIRCLLLSFFWQYMPDLLKNGRILSAVPPLYTISHKGKTHFAYDDKEMDRIAKRLGAGAEVKRFKGLGEMSAEDLAHTAMDPSTRTIREMTVEDADMAHDAFMTYMGPDSAGRKDWLTERLSGAD